MMAKCYLLALCLLCVSALWTEAAHADSDGLMVPFPMGGGYTILGGDFAEMFPGTQGTVHYSIGGGWEHFGFDLAVRMVFLEQPNNSPWVSVPYYGAVGPGFFFDIPLQEDDPDFFLTLRAGVNIAWIGVMYDSAEEEQPAYERVLMYGPSIEFATRFAYHVGHGIRLFTEFSHEGAYLQNARRGRTANGYLFHATAGFAMGFDML